MTVLNSDSLAFDRNSALNRVGGDMDLLREIGILFLQECPPAISELRSAVAARDALSIERRAHGLKGSISTFGTGAAFQGALELEQLGRNRSLEHVDSSLRRFENSLTHLCDELRAMVSE